MIKTLRMLVISMVFLVGTSLLADWETYVGDVLPSEAGFGRTNYNGPYGGDTTEIFSIIDDPAIMGNSLVKVFSDTSDAGHKEQWKYEYGGADSTGITLVWRAMVTDTSFMERGLNVYLYTGGYYDQVTSRNSSKNIKFEKNGSFSDEFDATQWHIYRMTVKGDSVAMYLDEETVPFLAGKTGSTSGSKYFRFGDSGGQTYGALYDWFAWDTTGAYNPSEGEILPSYLTGLPGRFTEGTWEVYDGSVLPSFAGFERTNYNGPYGGDTTEIFSIIDDSDISGNSLVKVFSDTANAGHKEQWKFNYGGDNETGHTLVWRAAVTDTAFMERGLNVYLYTGNYYDQITTRNSSKNLKFEKVGTFTEEFDATQFHVYRMTVIGDSVALYLDENPVPFLAGKTGSTSGSKYFRFGDSGGQTYGALYDWFAWDTTGAYAPGEDSPLPPSVTGTLPTNLFSLDGWDIYDGSVLPSVAGFERTNYNGSLGGDSTEIFSIIDDDVISGNKLVKVFSDTANAGHKEQWKFNYGGDNETGHTLVWRAAVTDTAFMERGLNVYLYTGNYYDQMTSRNSSKNLKLEKNGSFSEEFDATQFHVYRMTVIGDSVALYLDENPVPFIAGKTGSTSGSKYFRFGDSGGQTYGALYDWFIWDDTGAFSPEQKPVPRSLSGVATELTVDNHSVNVPNEFALSQNYPNPFNPTTQIMFKIGEAGNVKMNIYDIRGRLVQTLVNEHKPAGVHTVKWNGRNQFGNLVSTGIYFYNIEMGSYRETKRMLLMK